MNGQIMNEVPNRVWRGARAWRIQSATLVLTLFVFILAVNTTARAQAGGGHGAGKVSMRDVSFFSSVGVARGQMLQIAVVIPDDQDTGEPKGRLLAGTDLGVFAGHVKVFDALTNAEIATFELRNPTPGIHTFDIGGSGDDILFGGDTVYRVRVQLRIEVELVMCYDRTTNEFGADVLPPIFEIVERESGRTTVHSELVKVGAGRLVLNTANTY